MEYSEQVHLFATKWIEKFRDQKISYIELVDHYLADDCQALGFQMDCGHAFSEKNMAMQQAAYCIFLFRYHLNLHYLC